MAAVGRPSASGRGGVTCFAYARSASSSKPLSKGEDAACGRATATTRAFKKSIASALLIASLCSFAGPTAVLGASTPQGEKVEIPDDLKYIFGLRWCKKWSSGCFNCAGEGGEIVCERQKSDCDGGSRQLFYCSEYNVEMSCATWSDGCNRCGRAYLWGEVRCTGLACDPYYPRYVCLRRFFEFTR
jgi:hypothetical protein